MTETRGGAVADVSVLCQPGRALVAAEPAREYGFADVDGRRPLADV